MIRRFHIDSFSLDSGNQNLEISYSGAVSPEEYADLKGWMELWLRKMERRVVYSSPQIVIPASEQI